MRQSEGLSAEILNLAPGYFLLSEGQKSGGYEFMIKSQHLDRDSVTALGCGW